MSAVQDAKKVFFSYVNKLLLLFYLGVSPREGSYAFFYVNNSS